MGVRCVNPCEDCNVGKTAYEDLTALAYSLDSEMLYCVDSEGKYQRQAWDLTAGNWRLIAGCGTNNAAIWIQSYVSIKNLI